MFVTTYEYFSSVTSETNSLPAERQMADVLDSLDYLFSLFPFSGRKITEVSSSKIVVEEIGCNTGSIFRWTFESDNPSEFQPLLVGAYYQLLWIGEQTPLLEVAAQLVEANIDNEDRKAFVALAIAGKGSSALAYAMAMEVPRDELPACFPVDWRNWRDFQDSVLISRQTGQSLGELLNKFGVCRFDTAAA